MPKAIIVVILVKYKVVENIAIVHVNQYVFVVKIAKYNLERTINKCARPF